MKTFIAVVAVSALIAAGWFFRDSNLLAGAASSAQALVKDVLPDSGKAAKAEAEKKAAARADKPKGANPLRKCVAEGRIVYTDEKCPSGTREAPISEGNITVMPSQRKDAKPKADGKAN